MFAQLVHLPLGLHDFLAAVEGDAGGLGGALARSTERVAARGALVRAITEVGERSNGHCAHRIRRAADVAAHELVAEDRLAPMPITRSLLALVLDRNVAAATECAVGGDGARTRKLRV